MVGAMSVVGVCTRVGFSNLKNAGPESGTGAE